MKQIFMRGKVNLKNKERMKLIFLKVNLSIKTIRRKDSSLEISKNNQLIKKKPLKMLNLNRDRLRKIDKRKRKKANK